MNEEIENLSKKIDYILKIVDNHELDVRYFKERIDSLETRLIKEDERGERLEWIKQKYVVIVRK